MAKRELISKNSIISLYKYFSKGERVFAGQVIVDVKAIPPITEQEIVKPYLEAIEAEAIKYSGTGEREIQAYDEGLLKAIEIIKNLLSEQEVK